MTTARKWELFRGIPLIGPALALTAILILFPFVFAIVLSVVHWTASGTLGSFAGIGNYRHMFTDPVFWESVRITLEIFIVGLIVETALGIGVGYLLSLDVPGRRVLQALILIPSITASVAVGLVWLLMYDPTLGILNYILNAVGLGSVNWLGSPSIVVWSLILVDAWQWTPFMALIIAAGIRSLPVEPFEAAAVDGASGWRMGWHVGLPLLWPVITVAMLIRSVDLIRFFDTVYIMTQGGPVNSSTTLNVYAYRQAFMDLNVSYGSTIQIALIVIVLLVAGGVMLLRRTATSYA
ncbi:MAG: carbohydrate ABC transporter permease [Acidimicrobiales bacterium]